VARNGSVMRICIEVATVRRAAELLNKNKSWKNQNDFMAFNGIAFESQSFRASHPGID